MDKNFDYTVYEGKEIKVVESGWGDFDAVVVGCEYNIGITIARKEDLESNYVCLLNAKTLKRVTSDTEVEYDQCFDMLIKFIADGVISEKVMRAKVFGIYGLSFSDTKGIPKEYCAFSQ